MTVPQGELMDSGASLTPALKADFGQGILGWLEGLRSHFFDYIESEDLRCPWFCFVSNAVGCGSLDISDHADLFYSVFLLVAVEIKLRLRPHFLDQPYD